MRVFVTGASGGIGSAVVPELIAAGHEVVGLARSDTAARRIAEAGATVLRGTLSDLPVLRAGAEQADGVINLAFGNDFTDIEANMAEEARALDALGDALAGTGKPLVAAFGTPVVPGRAATEVDPTPTDGPMAGRGRSAVAVLGLADRGVRSSVVRLPRSVHEAGLAYGFASFLIATARRAGVVGYVGDGAQRWPAVHRLDAARLFRLALEEADPGTVLHAVGDEGDHMRDLSEAIGEQLGLPVRQVPAEDYGFLGQIFAIDQPATSTLTRERFGWQPTHPSLLDDLRAGGYPQ
jgi:nucleoside-diphosphate-sugar epimerase